MAQVSTSDLAPAHGWTAAALGALAQGIPTPVDAHFGPCRAYLSLVEPGGTGKATWRVAFGLDGGRVMQPAGPVLGQRAAMALARLLNERLGA